MRIKANSFKTFFTVLALAGVLTSCAYTATERCNIDQSEYPLQHEMSNGRSVPVHWHGNECILDTTAVTVMSEMNGQTCRLGYRCERRTGGGR